MKPFTERNFDVIFKISDPKFIKKLCYENKHKLTNILLCNVLKCGSLDLTLIFDISAVLLIKHCGGNEMSFSPEVSDQFNDF